MFIFPADRFPDPEPLNGITAAMLKRTQEYNETLEEVKFKSIMYGDPNTDYSRPMLLMARPASGEGNTFLAGQAMMDI